MNASRSLIAICVPRVCFYVPSLVLPSVHCLPFRGVNNICSNDSRFNDASRLLYATIPRALNAQKISETNHTAALCVLTLLVHMLAHMHTTCVITNAYGGEGVPCTIHVQTKPANMHRAYTDACNTYMCIRVVMMKQTAFTLRAIECARTTAYKTSMRDTHKLKATPRWTF